MLVAPAQQYAEQLTSATLEKLNPLTNLVRDAVEGVAEARLSLQEQSHQIRSSMDGVASELCRSLQELEPVLRQLQAASDSGLTKAEDLNHLKATVELRRAIEALNRNLEQLHRQQRQPVWWAPWRRTVG